MKDIKKRNKITEKKVEKITALFVNENFELRESGNRFGKYIFSGMILSIFAYLFFVTSSIFYAINTQKYTYEIGILDNLAREVGIVINTTNITDGNEASVSNGNITFTSKKDRISYINRNADTVISLK
jgi:hypothetical protein